MSERIINVFDYKKKGVNMTKEDLEKKVEGRNNIFDELLTPTNRTSKPYDEENAKNIFEGIKEWHEALKKYQKPPKKLNIVYNH